DGRDVFAWQDQPTLARYLAAGPAKLLELRVTGLGHNLVSVLVLLGVPLSIVGLVGLPAAVRPPSSWIGASKPSTPPAAVDRSAPKPLLPLLFFSVITFLVASLVFPVSTTWGTFLHAAGAIHVLLLISALLVLDGIIGWVGRR